MSDGQPKILIQRTWLDEARGEGCHPHQAENTFLEHRPGLPAATHLWSDHSAITINSQNGSPTAFCTRIQPSGTNEMILGPSEKT